MDKLYQQWKKEEQALFSGWDFSHLKNRLIEQEPSWDYIKIAKSLIKKSKAVLDMGTGGGELLFKLGPFPEHIIATETYTPNISLAQNKLKPLGIKVVKVNNNSKLPFKNGGFDLVLNRHSDFNAQEIYRILKPDGIFITQQVSSNDLFDLKKEFKRKITANWNLEKAIREVKQAGFIIKDKAAWQGKIEFKDVGALIYYFKSIPWIIEGFSVDKYLPVLNKLQQKINNRQKLSFTKARFFIKAQK